MPRLLLSALLVSVIAAGMLTDAHDPELHAQIVDAAAMTWDREASLEFWRVPLSPLVQEDPGLSWLILVLLPAIPLAELRFGPARTAIYFFGGDAFATLVPLAALGAWNTLGLPDAAAAAAAAAEPNVGSSAGLYALVAALIAALPARRARYAAGTILAGVLLYYLIDDGDLADVQHIVAVLAGAAIASIHRRRDEQLRSLQQPGVTTTG